MGTRRRKRITTLDADELAKETAEFDRAFVVKEFAPLSPAASRRWTAAKRRRGRPRRGHGVTVSSLSVERGLLRKTDALAKRLKTSRARLVELGLRRVLREAS